MTKIRFNRAAIKELEELGIFDEWLTQLKLSWSSESNLSGAGFSIKRLESLDRGYNIIYHSFIWSRTVKGTEYWSDIYYRLLV